MFVKTLTRAVQVSEPNCRKCREIKAEFQSKKNEEAKQEDVEETVFFVNQSGIFPSQPAAQRFSDILRQSILTSTYYQEIKSMHFQDLLTQIETHVSGYSAWVKGAYGVPSSLSCIVYRLIELNLFEHQVSSMLNSAKQYVQYTGCLYIRYAAPFE